jgi:bifunctional DNA-binding transcriptional regulator/antitoxin component of YhaV-PrlF toxin-antitoxin module
MSTEEAFLTTTRIMTKGQIDVPDQYIEELHLEAGTTVTLMRIGEGLLIVPENSELTRLSASVQEAMNSVGVSKEEVLEGLEESRRVVYDRLYGGKKNRRRGAKAR